MTNPTKWPVVWRKKNKLNLLNGDRVFDERLGEGHYRSSAGNLSLVLFESGWQWVNINQLTLVRRLRRVAMERRPSKSN